VSPVIAALWGQSGANLGFSCPKRCGKSLKSLVSRLSSVVEQRFCKPLVGGSNPSVGTNDFNNLEGAANATLFFAGVLQDPMPIAPRRTTNSGRVPSRTITRSAASISLDSSAAE
jgi:hypothetical protein